MFLRTGDGRLDPAADFSSNGDISSAKFVNKTDNANSNMDLVGATAMADGNAQFNLTTQRPINLQRLHSPEMDGGIMDAIKRSSAPTTNLASAKGNGRSKGKKAYGPPNKNISSLDRKRQQIM